MSSGINRRSFLAGWPGFFWHRRERTMCGVRFRVVRHGDSPRRYLFIHGNEDTAREVLTAQMARQNGMALLVTGQDRIVGIQGLKIDPNRFWSRVGAEASLRRLNTGADGAQVAGLLGYLDKHREGLLRMLTPGRGSRLFALHNNRGYSVNDELAASDETSIKQPEMPRYFFLCTDAGDFGVLKESPYNVVLQAKAEPDDGSMSRLAARRGFRYINLECALGDFAGQMERVRWLEQHLP